VVVVTAGCIADDRIGTDYRHRRGGTPASMTDTRVRTRGGRLQMQRSRGAMSGVLLILLGAWGAIIPFVGPFFDFAFSPDRAWAWSEARGWLQVLPGVVAVVGGLLLLASSNRATAMLGGWLGVLAGAWFVVGRASAGLLGIGDVGSPVAATETKNLVLELAYFSGLGALIVFVGAAALGRVSVRSVRDVEYVDNAVAPVLTQPTFSDTDAVTEIQPAASDTGRHHRSGGWRNTLSRRRTPAH